MRDMKIKLRKEEYVSPGMGQSSHNAAVKDVQMLRKKEFVGGVGGHRGNDAAVKDASGQERELNNGSGFHPL